MSGIIDCEMHIGDEVFVHGYIDEIRNDTIIIRNVGGYFGTSRDEVFYYEEDERGYGTMNEADRKTEPQTYCDNCMYLHCNYECAREIVHKMIDDAVIAEDAYPDLRQKLHDAVDEYEPQTEKTEMERLERIDNEIEDAWARIRELTDEPKTDCAWK